MSPEKNPTTTEVPVPSHPQSPLASGGYNSRNRWIRWLAGSVFALVVTFAFVARTFPYLPRPLALTVIFPKAAAGEIEPLISSGSFSQADFLSVRYLSETTAVLEYAAWGPDGPTSRPFSFEPGKRHSLIIDMPALDFGGTAKKRENRPLRLTLDGTELIHEPVFFYARKPQQVYFGLNPIGGGKADGVVFRGQLIKSNGRVLLGGPETYFSFGERFGALVTRHPIRLGLIVLASVAFGLAWMPAWHWTMRRLRAAQRRPLTGHTTAPHRTFVTTAIVCTVVFAALITHGTFRFIFEESFGSFYDHQAVSLLKGRLDVPREIIGGEAFIVDGKSYGYFGITPAVLRLPFAAAGVAIGKLSRVYMLGYYVACLIGAYLLLCHASRMLGSRPAWPSTGATVLLTLSLGLGSSLFFLGARAYLYHEAILCGATLALWTVYCTFRYLELPRSRWWWGALGCGLFAVHARPSSGLFALCVLGVATLWCIIVSWRNRNPADALRHVAIGALAATAIVSFNGMSYLKFGTFDGSPFQYAVQYTPERIARFEGKNFHLSNVPRNIDTYVLQPDFRLEARFPFFFLHGSERSYPAARIDYSEWTLAFPYAMPALFALAMIGGAWATWRSAALRPASIVLLVGCTPMALALFSAVVTSHRYTADFCPFFAAAAALGLAVLDAEGYRLRRTFLTITGVLVVVAIAVNLAIALHFAGEVAWGVSAETKQSYEALRRGVDAFFGIK